MRRNWRKQRKMKKVKRIHTAVACITAVITGCAFSACSNETYDTGDGSMSYLTADFADAATDSEARFQTAKTDNGLLLSLSPSIKAEWATAADSIYRCLLYYNVEKGMPTTGDASLIGEATARPVSIQRVLVPQIVDGRNAAKPLPTDPLTLETAWTSKNGRYINLGIILKTGTADGKTTAQSIGVAYTGTETNADGTKRHRLQLIHEQNGVPEYYSTSAYVSIPLYRLPFATQKGDEIVVSATTYDGRTERSFLLGKLPAAEAKQ